MTEELIIRKTVCLMGPKDIGISPEAEAELEKRMPDCLVHPLIKDLPESLLPLVTIDMFLFAIPWTKVVQENGTLNLRIEQVRVVVRTPNNTKQISLWSRHLVDETLIFRYRNGRIHTPTKTIHRAPEQRRTGR